ncbi:MAG: prolyl oligopeptidase family serine peptidase [Saprospiraceae bacterium]|nr:prolyl oligopeptidase family serine peptidase [Saprospiraceae bacterium]
MKNILLLLILSGFSHLTIAQSPANQVVIGHKDSIYSKVLKEARTIWIHIPHQGDDLFAKKTYPVVYLLDGEAHFPSVATMIQSLSANSICPDMIIVGIENTNRTRDLTPSKGDSSHPFVAPGMVEASGGGDNFLRFIKEELKPYVEANYPVNSFEMLIGHSFGGLLAMHAFKHQPDLFDAFISIDPSMWWSQESLLKEIKASEWTSAHQGKMLYLGIANTLEEGMTVEAALEDKGLLTGHFRALMELHDHLLASKGDEIKYAGKYYENDDHGSVPLITEYDAVRFFFDFYKLVIGPQDFMDPSVGVAAKMQKHYKVVSKEMGMTILPDESMVNQMGYNMLEMQMLSKAKQLFEMNTKNYPDSFNTHDSLGDYYMAVEDLENAKKSFQKAFDLNPDGPSKQKLEDLKK